MPSLRVVPVLLAVATVAMLAACGSSASPADHPGTTLAGSSAPSASESAWASLGGDLGVCGPQPPDAAAAGFRYRVLRDPRIGTLPAVTAGRGPTVAVLLHQTDGNGFCGWLPFAARIVAEPGLAVLAVDLCGYVDASCRPGVTASRAAAFAVDVARTRLHATRVVLVGSSMGGAETLITATRKVPIDAAVDLSGPVDWPGVAAVRGGRALKVPVLVAMADSEGARSVTAAREVATHAPTGSRFVPASSGHGYELLLDADGEPGPLAQPVLDWIRGG